MKLVPALILASLGDVRPVSDVVLHVTERRGPAAADGWMKMLLFAVTAVVDITQVAVEALVAQENAPDDAAEHATREGLAALPAAEQFVTAIFVAVTAPPKDASPN